MTDRAVAAKRKPLWPRVLIAMVIGGVAVGAFAALGVEGETFAPIGLGVVGAGFALFLMQAYARVQLREFLYAHKLLRAKRYADAADLLERFLDRIDKRPGILTWQALATGVRKMPIEAVTHFQLGMCHFNSDRLAEAQRAFERASDLATNFGEAMYNAAITAAKRKQRDTALQWLVRAAPHRTALLTARAKVAPELEGLREHAAYRTFVADD